LRGDRDGVVKRDLFADLKREGITCQAFAIDKLTNAARAHIGFDRHDLRLCINVKPVNVVPRQRSAKAKARAADFAFKDAIGDIRV
jgi:hypothetical protein